jgi:hypothetical protein
MQQYTLDSGKNFKLCENGLLPDLFHCLQNVSSAPGPDYPCAQITKPSSFDRYLPTCTIISPVFCALVRSHFHMFAFFLTVRRGGDLFDDVRSYRKVISLR